MGVTRVLLVLFFTQNVLALSLATLGKFARAMKDGNVISCDPVASKVEFMHAKNFNDLPTGVSFMHGRLCTSFDSLLNNLAVTAHVNFDDANMRDRLEPGMAVSRSMAGADVTYIFRPHDFESWRPHLGISVPLFRIHEKRIGREGGDEFCYAGSSLIPTSLLSKATDQKFKSSAPWTHATLVELDPLECFMGIQVASSDTASVSIRLPRITIHQRKTVDGDTNIPTAAKAGISGSLNGRLTLMEWDEAKLSLLFLAEHKIWPRRLLVNKKEIEGKTKKNSVVLESTTVSHRSTEILAMFHLDNETMFATAGYKLSVHRTSSTNNVDWLDQTVMIDVGVVGKTSNLVGGIGVEANMMPLLYEKKFIRSLLCNIGITF